MSGIIIINIILKANVYRFYSCPFSFLFNLNNKYSRINWYNLIAPVNPMIATLSRSSVTRCPSCFHSCDHCIECIPS